MAYDASQTLWIPQPEAYGYRLKCHKGEFGKTADWKQWSPEMQEYCVQDVAVLVKLWNHFQKYLKQSA